MNRSAGGLYTVPPYTGHKLPRIRNNDDLPHPVIFTQDNAAQKGGKRLTIRPNDEEMLLSKVEINLNPRSLVTMSGCHLRQA